MDWKQLGPYIVPALVVLLLARRLITNKPQKVRVNLLFLRPLIIAFAVVAERIDLLDGIVLKGSRAVAR